MTSRIYLEKFTSDEDFEYYFSLVSNEKVMAMVTERAIPLDEARSNFKLLLEKNKRHKEFGIFIGLGKMAVDKDKPDEAELGYLLLPEFWGKGYGSEIARLLLEKARESKVLRRITAIIDPKNTASKKILLNNGFISEKICEIDGLPGEIFGRNL